MTDEQFERWMQFSIRISVHGFPEATKQRRRKIIKQVANYFRWRNFQRDWSGISSWDGIDDEYYLSDAVSDFFNKYLHWRRKEEYYGGKFFDQITSCIKAGFDVAVKPSAGGVLGFTVGDVRHMWQGCVPEWVVSQIDNFSNLSDRDEVWL